MKNLGINTKRILSNMQPSFPTSQPGCTYYQTKSGDTYYEIARRFGITVECLVRFNPPQERDIFFPKICIPPTWACLIPPCPEGGNLYTVQPGDTLAQIANLYRIPLNCLILFNPQIPDPNLIIPGQIICIPPAGQCRPTLPCPEGGEVYTIRAGETLFSIARRYGISLQCLLQYNPHLNDPIRDFIPQVICIPPASACPQPVEDMAELPLLYPVYRDPVYQGCS